jgi:hypothetical protein
MTDGDVAIGGEVAGRVVVFEFKHKNIDYILSHNIYVKGKN